MTLVIISGIGALHALNPEVLKYIVNNGIYLETNCEK